MLELTCQWQGPDGDVRYGNAWRTKRIARDPWTTHCRHTFGPSDPAGTWTVVMRAAGRNLAQKPFMLE